MAAAAAATALVAAAAAATAAAAAATVAAVMKVAASRFASGSGYSCYVKGPCRLGKVSECRRPHVICRTCK